MAYDFQQFFVPGWKQRLSALRNEAFLTFLRIWARVWLERRKSSHIYNYQS